MTANTSLAAPGAAALAEPLTTPDGRWYFTGRQWWPVPQPRADYAFVSGRFVRRPLLDRLPTSLKVASLCWFVLLVAWVPAATFTLVHHWAASGTIALSSSTGGFAVGATVVLGILAGRHRAWAFLAWDLLIGLFLLGFALLVTFSATQPANGPDDQGLGLGALAITAAIAPILAALAFGSAGITRLLVRSARDRTGTEVPICSSAPPG